MWFGSMQGGHEVVQLFLVEGRDGFAATLLLLAAPAGVFFKVGLARMVFKHCINQPEV